MAITQKCPFCTTPVRITNTQWPTPQGGALQVLCWCSTCQDRDDLSVAVPIDPDGKYRCMICNESFELLLKCPMEEMNEN